MTVASYILVGFLIRVMAGLIIDLFVYVLRKNNFEVSEPDWQLELIKLVVSLILIVPAVFLIYFAL